MTTETLLRDLAVAGAPSVSAPPYLAEKVLARRRSGTRRRLGAVVLLAAATTGLLAARGEGGRYFAQYQPSGSMEPTVQIGGSVVADRTLTAARDDVVVAAVGGGTTIKRVMGVAGDRVACPAGPDGRCHGWVRNGQVLVEPFTSYTEGVGDDPFAELTVPAGRLFLLGDHRDNSADSRQNGPVDAGDVRGVGVEIRDPDGTVHAVPGAPVHERPGGIDTDPAGPLEPAHDVPVTP